MKKYFRIIIILLCSIGANAKEQLYIHETGGSTLGAPISILDSIYFSDDNEITYIQLKDTTLAYIFSELDSITFGEASKIVYINYQGEKIKIFNPLAYEGVNVSANGSKVLVSSIFSEEVEYIVSGNSQNGALKIYSNNAVSLTLQNLLLTNSDGPAINNQSETDMKINLPTGTESTLTDGTTYSTAPNGSDGEPEDMPAVLFAEGNISFSGDGSLTIVGLGTKKNGIESDGKIIIDGTKIIISSAAKDGIHSNDGFVFADGSLEIASSGDGIDGDASTITILGGKLKVSSSSTDVSAIKSDSTITIEGGETTITVAGDQSKGIKSDMPIIIKGGNIDISTSGNAVLEEDGSGFDPSYCSAIKSETEVRIEGGTIAVNADGIAGKGISSDADLNITGGVVTINCSGNGAKYTDSDGLTDVYNATCVSADGNINIVNGELTLTASGSASKGISSDANITIGSSNYTPIINISTTGAKILISGSGNNAEYSESKTLKADGTLTIDNGVISISSADDGMKAEEEIIINGGTIDIKKSVEGIEAPSIIFNGGYTKVASTDDALNATMGNGGEGNDGSILDIRGGEIYLNPTGGDGLDSNGDITMSGGTVVVHGPQSQPEVGIDVNGTFNMSGGFLIVSSPNSMMLEGVSSSSPQYSLIIKSQQQLSTSTLFHIEDGDGNSLATFQPKRQYNAIIFSSKELISGKIIKIFTGGSSTGTNIEGNYIGGTYSGGTLKKTVTISQKVTNITF